MEVSDDVKKAQQRIAGKKYYAANKEKIATKNKAYKAANAEKERIRMKKYRAANQDKIAAKGKKYRAANAEKDRARKKKYYDANKDKTLTKQKEYRQKSKDVRLAKDKSWYMANSAYKNAYRRAHYARKKAIAAGEIPPPMPKLADFRAQHDASGSVAPAASTDAAPDDLLDEDDDVSHPLAATAKKVVMVSFTDENPFNMRERGPEPCCDECALFQPNALTSATNTVLLAGTYMCTFCRDWTYYRLHRKHKRTRADARLDALTA